MVGKAWKRIYALILAAVLIIGMVPGNGLAVSAKESADNKVQVFFNPLYEEDIPEADVVLMAEKLLSNGIESFGEPVWLENAEAAMAYIREQMVLRNTEIVFKLGRSALSGGIDAEQLFLGAMEHTEGCSGQEGDALSFGWSSLGISTSSAPEYCQIRYQVSYLSDAAQEAALTEAVEQAMKSMNLEGLLEYEKVERIYDYICENVNYDYSYSKYSAYEALCNKTAVCQGYAILFYRLAKEAGLSVRIISGRSNYQAHAWNIVRIGGRYYNVDCTWDGQDAETYHNYFLKNERDFTNHNRDEEYTTSEFLAAYPVAEKSWKDYSLDAELPKKNNYQYSFTTLEGKTVTSTANKKPKVLFFYNRYCPNSQYFLEEMGRYTFSDADIIAVEVMQNSKSDIKQFRDQYVNNGIIFTYNDKNNDDINAMWRYESLMGDTGTISFPYIVCIDGNNKVRYAANGGATPAEIEGIIQSCDIDRVLPTSTSFDKKSIQLEVGKTGKVTATVKPNNATYKTVGYEVADPGIARVDCNGNVTALSRGKTTITAYAVDAFSTTQSSCEVIVVGKMVQGLNLSSTASTLRIGETVTLTATVTPADAENRSVIWTTSDPNVVAVDQNGTVTAMGGGRAIVTATAADGSGVSATCSVTVTIFSDVAVDSWYYDPVSWAVKQGITNGYGSASTFCPELTCTRGQVVTFLWRANGSPEPTSLNNPFDDVAGNAYYYKAVLWAVENGITAGYGSDNIFNPDGACNRAQVATFLWRASGKPAVNDRTNPFVDVKEGEYYYDAVLWAVENGVTNGYGGNTTFAPDVNCSRGQIVTFLYRAMN